MKTEIKLEEIVGYLPYGLKICFFKHGIQYRFDKLNSIVTTYNGSCVNLINSISDIKPILRPLSDLKNKDLDYWIEFSQAIDEMNTDYLIDALVNGTFYSKDIHFSFKLLKVLYSMHFDIHNLIERGLAIDINTLEK
jgi:hypothetical protein